MAENKRTIIKNAIESGDYTKEQLMELADVNAAGFASQMSYLRMGGIFPIAGEDGVFRIITEEEWEAQKAERKSKPKVELTPVEQREKLEKKASRAASAHTNAEKKFDNSADEVDGLKVQVAELNLRIAEIALGRHQDEFGDIELDEAPEIVEGGAEDVDAEDELM